MRRIASIALAAILSVAPVAAVLADASTPENLTVSTATTITGAPASIAYGAAAPGATATAPLFTITASTNYVNGAKVTMSLTDLTKAAQPNIPVGNHHLTLASTTATAILNAAHG